MASRAFEEWRTDACAAFDEIKHAHRMVGGTRPGRRFLTQQINYAYVTLLAARFQGFARALHSQTVDVIAVGAHSTDYGVLLGESLTSARELDRRNAHPVSIAKDFERFGIDVWGQLAALEKRNDGRRRKLESLITWRNAIAHHDIEEKLSAGSLHPAVITLGTCTDWRSALGALAVCLDKVAADRCEALGLPRPW